MWRRHLTAAGELWGVFMTLPVDGTVTLVLLEVIVASLICRGFLIKQKAEIFTSSVSHFHE